jgi:hypothetical protein
MASTCPRGPFGSRPSPKSVSDLSRLGCGTDIDRSGIHGVMAMTTSAFMITWRPVSGGPDNHPFSLPVRTWGARRSRRSPLLGDEAVETVWLRARRMSSGRTAVGTPSRSRGSAT